MIVGITNVASNLWLSLYNRFIATLVLKSSKILLPLLHRIFSSGSEFLIPIRLRIHKGTPSIMYGTRDCDKAHSPPPDWVKIFFLQIQIGYQRVSSCSLISIIIIFSIFVFFNSTFTVVCLLVQFIRDISDRQPLHCSMVVCIDSRSCHQSLSLNFVHSLPFIFFHRFFQCSSQESFKVYVLILQIYFSLFQKWYHLSSVCQNKCSTSRACPTLPQYTLLGSVLSSQASFPHYISIIHFAASSRIKMK